jgi:transposase InsO family protein
MKQAIADLVQGCAICLAMLPSLPNEPLQEGSIPEGPMSHLGLDLFACHGEDWLPMVDRYSGFPFCHKLRSTVTSSVTKVLHAWFCEWGFPQVLRSDGGPQFRSEFREFCAKHNIEHELSSPYNPQSNGLAEAGVKNVKRLLKKCRKAGKHFPSALLEWRNTPRADGVSPAQVFFGRRQRTLLPALPRVNLPDSIQQFGEIRKKAKDIKDEQRNVLRQELPVFQIGEEVLVQHPKDKMWESSGVIGSVHQDGRSYEVLMHDSGKYFRRNRRHLRRNTARISAESDDTGESGAKGGVLVPSLRRSKRIADQVKPDPKCKSITFAKRILVSYF